MRSKTHQLTFFDTVQFSDGLKEFSDCGNGPVLNRVACFLSDLPQGTINRLPSPFRVSVKETITLEPPDDSSADLFHPLLVFIKPDHFLVCLARERDLYTP